VNGSIVYVPRMSVRVFSIEDDAPSRSTPPLKRLKLLRRAASLCLRLATANDCCIVVSRRDVTTVWFAKRLNEVNDKTVQVICYD